jgi:prephenate dehydrogenase
MRHPYGATLTNRSAHIVGLGLIGSSVALALRHAGWAVTGFDADPAVVAEALSLAVIDSTELDERVSLVVVATPAGAVPEVVASVLPLVGGDTIVTDVAGVKREIVGAISDPRFLGGHPMAGSELRGIKGARADLFQGCTWILTPTDSTDADRYARLHGWLRELSASVIAVSALDHDRLVAIASHVPHMLAGALMNHAAEAAKEDAVLLQLAAGGFRDMTRIAAGDPTIWPDILFQNKVAIIDSLDDMESRIDRLRQALLSNDTSAVMASLTAASQARRQLPGRSLASEALVQLRIPMPDRPGVLAAITMVASEQGINIYDIEIAHGIEGSAGTLLLTVDRNQADELIGALANNGFLAARTQ